MTSNSNLPKFMLGSNTDPIECGIIRVTDVSKEFSDISHLSFKSTLDLHFDDVEDGDGLLNVISKEHAEAILDFLIDNCNSIKHLIICCDDGSSRSAAVAAAVRLKLGLGDWGVWQDGSKKPNMMVFKLLVDTFGIPLLDEEIAKRETIQSMYSNKYNDSD